uniref:Thioredoxin domain-containing protein n=1 Tax=Chromera velia CCMP2878 TaxID=1169474 RepID=A0A0G4I1J1_9ALVE|eukprot:Cvel_10125.t1-p1 / transcript=Cvel_10125.t1 / gene=Cvel_10125 / organism=Chromera_velia_CCMP2878 / gene_product=Peroxiredoxin-2E-1, chloroplastic, putative / transcript_product=Peroxiredoxin-2E-1, chloroplastic, putative / location=Cvel_scaffold603:66949-69209(-) / protein_length=245 / sequence_SO=supercontig / SO=protein_coding / is_pseudo=false
MHFGVHMMVRSVLLYLGLLWIPCRAFVGTPRLMKRRCGDASVGRAEGQPGEGDGKPERIRPSLRLPDVELSCVNDNTMISSRELFRERSGVLFAVPGAFTPTCSEKHLPGFLAKVKDFRKKYMDVVACVSVNDPFVMKAWADQMGIKDEVLMLSDGNGEFTKMIGMEQDLSEHCMGIRSKRYALIVTQGGLVRWVGEGESAFAEEVLEQLSVLRMILIHNANSRTTFALRGGRDMASRKGVLPES